MLTCVESPYRVFKNKMPEDGIIIEPSRFINNFIFKSINKFGVLKAPDNILSMINLFPERSLSVDLLKDYESPLKGVFVRPNYDNMNELFMNAKKKLETSNEVFATPVATALFLEWLIKENIEININLNLQVELETIYNEYAKERNKIFVPIVTERLLKLFSIFYRGEIKKETKFFSAIQLNLLDTEKKNDLSFIKKSNFKDIIKIIERIKEKHKGEFSSNNIFNKLLEDLHTVQDLKRKGYKKEIIKNSIVLEPIKESLEKSKEDFKAIIEG